MPVKMSAKGKPSIKMNSVTTKQLLTLLSVVMVPRHWVENKFARVTFSQHTNNLKRDLLIKHRIGEMYVDQMSVDQISVGHLQVKCLSDNIKIYVG